MSVPDRIYKIAQAYLDAARGRLDEIDSAAKRELDRALGPEGTVQYPGASDDPMDRAAAKIAAARGSAAARQELPERLNFSTPEPVVVNAADPDAVQSAYKIIGVPVGSNYADVEKAVAKLRERAAPSRFPEGSAEQLEAQRIQERVDRAFETLQDALGVQRNRFDRLEL